MTKEKTPLRKAVDWLKKERRIAKDNDLVEIFTLDKSTISIYLNKKASPEFENQFEEYFKISLKEFEKNVPEIPVRVTVEDKIAMLNDVVLELTKEVARLRELDTKKSALDFYLGIAERLLPNKSVRARDV